MPNVVTYRTYLNLQYAGEPHYRIFIHFESIESVAEPNIKKHIPTVGAVVRTKTGESYLVMQSAQSVLEMIEECVKWHPNVP